MRSGKEKKLLKGVTKLIDDYQERLNLIDRLNYPSKLEKGKKFVYVETLMYFRKLL